MFFFVFGGLFTVEKVDVFAFDYTGFGRHEGESSEQACYNDVFVCYSYMTKQMKIPGNQIILYDNFF